MLLKMSFACLGCAMLSLPLRLAGGQAIEMGGLLGATSAIARASGQTQMVLIPEFPAASTVSAMSDDASSTVLSYDLGDTALSFNVRQLLSGAASSSTDSEGYVDFDPTIDLHYDLSGTFSTRGQLWNSHVPTGRLQVELAAAELLDKPFSYDTGAVAAPLQFDIGNPSGNLNAGGSLSGTLRPGQGGYLFSFAASLAATGPGSAASASGRVSLDLSLLGDFNHDGSVGFDDLIVLARHYGQEGPSVTYQTGDVNQDGNVGFDDLLILARNYGKSIGDQMVGTQQVVGVMLPEPSSGGVLWGLVTAMLWRRRADGNPPLH